VVDLVADPGEEGLTGGRLQHEQGEGELETDAPGHGLPPDRAAVGGQGVGDAHDDHQADQREAALHTGDGAYVCGWSASRVPTEAWALQTCASLAFAATYLIVADSRTYPPEESARDAGRAFTIPPANVQDIAYRYRFRPDPGFEYISPSATAITGYTPEEHYADPGLGARLVFPQGRPAPGGDPMLESAVASTFMARWVQKDGAVLWTEQRNTAVRDETGRVIAIEGVAREITARKRAEDETRLLQALTQAIGEAADLDSALSVAIEQLCVFTGWDYGEGWMPNQEGRFLERAFTWCAAASGAGEFRARSEGAPSRAGKAFRGASGPRGSPCGTRT
jgi:hypothetical protein